MDNPNVQDADIILDRIDFGIVQSRNVSEISFRGFLFANYPDGIFVEILSNDTPVFGVIPTFGWWLLACMNDAMLLLIGEVWLEGSLP
jgi:hypothetical protein